MRLTKDVEVLSTIPLFATINPTNLKSLACTSERLESVSRAMSCFTRMTTPTLSSSSSRARPTSSPYS